VLFDEAYRRELKLLDRWQRTSGSPQAADMRSAFAIISEA
jgi:hypothetical protein